MFDRIMAEEHEVRAWESHQLRASSPDGERAFWLLHDIVADGPTWADRTVHVQLLAFSRTDGVHLARADYRWSDMTRLFRGPQIEGPCGRYEPGAAKGAIVDCSWDFVSAGGLPPIRHLPHEFLYATGRGNNKLVTPQPCLKVAGVVNVAGETWELENWVGSRGHLWGPRVGGAGWLACHRWDDGSQRALEGLVGASGFGQMAVVVLEGPESAHWIRRGELTGNPHDGLRSSRGGYALSARADRLISLRAPAPGGDAHRRVTPFASVELRTPRTTATSQVGGLEFLDETTPPDHAWPPASWDGSPLTASA